MMPRDWADNELLTAAALNELTTSISMPFADAAARDAFLTDDLAPAPGMTAFMLDSNTALTYLIINGVGYWTPPPQTLCFYAQQAATQALASQTYTAITGYTLANHGNRNLSGWFDTASGKFTPKIPGIYEFFGGLSMTSAPVATGALASQRGGFRLDETGAAAYDTRSENRQVVTVNVPVSFGLRRYLMQLNGTTDYVEMVAWATGATNTATGAQAPIFGAKYLGQ
jgi:hypothetical protein